jgi:hypothetical protein
MLKNALPMFIRNAIFTLWLSLIEPMDQLLGVRRAVCPAKFGRRSQENLLRSIRQIYNLDGLMRLCTVPRPPLLLTTYGILAGQATLEPSQAALSTFA